MCKKIVDCKVFCARTMVWVMCVDKSVILRQFAVGFCQKHKDAFMKSHRGYSQGFLSHLEENASIEGEDA